MNFQPEQISRFADARYWIEYFPPECLKDIRRFGAHVDTQRSFITTDRNPYFDSFVRWQFTRLKERGFIKFGKRPSIFSPKDQQMCADHDRAEGEEVVPEEYTLIKIRVLEPNECLRARLGTALQAAPAYLVAATLRPETMYGQTACFLLPSGDYVAARMKGGDIFICSARSALNMAYQELTQAAGVVETLAHFKGEELLGLALEGPLALCRRIYSLPMLTISMSKGTGVVSCVPSDSPDDWMAICDLRSKKALREKYGIAEEMVAIEPVEIIETPGLGRLPARCICEQMKIRSQNDRELLAEAKNEVYKKGFSGGRLLVGEFQGRKVSEGKPLIKDLLCRSGQAVVYHEPNGVAISRSGDECVVALCDQWYLNYADEGWKARVLDFVEKQFRCNNPVLHESLVHTIHWLKEWGCSRSFGLGSRLPFDDPYLIESLSDSTIYFAFYTVAHLLQGDVFGDSPGELGIRPEDLTPDFWDFVLLGQPYLRKKVPQQKLDRLRASFLYWYPLDLRCSGKDLIKNHLTMALFNHAAIWDDSRFWPRSYYCNGFINVEGVKMSKSKGNFILMREAAAIYGVDATRLACAQAGDSINDANFTQENANAAIIQLSTLEMFLSKGCLDTRPAGEDRLADTIFKHEMEHQIAKVRQAYEAMVFRDVVKHGLHDFVSLRDLYVLNCGHDKPRFDLLLRYVYLQLLFIYPVCPHFAETAYLDYFLALTPDPAEHPPYLGQCSFPVASTAVNLSVIRMHQYYQKLVANLRDLFARASKGKDAHFSSIVFVFRAQFHAYQLDTLRLLKSKIVEDSLAANWRDALASHPDKDTRIKMLQFGGFVEKEFKTLGHQALEEALPFDEQETLREFAPLLRREFPLEIKIFSVADCPPRAQKNWQDTLANVTPGNPVIYFE